MSIVNREWNIVKGPCFIKAFVSSEITVEVLFCLVIPLVQCNVLSPEIELDERGEIRIYSNEFYTHF